MRRWPVVLAMVLSAACASATKQIPAERLALVPEPDRELAESLATAAAVVAGRLLRVEEAAEYERPGPVVIGLAGNKAVAARAYNGDIRVDSTLLGSTRPTLRITFFATRGAAVPRPDTTAIWVLHRRVLWRLRECSERQSVSSTACPFDNGLALDSDADILPLDNWPRLRDILRTLGLGAAKTR